MDLLRKCAPFVGLALLAYLLVRCISAAELMAVLRGVSLPFLGASLGCTTLLTLGKMHRVHLLLHREGAGVRFGALARGYVLANLMGQLSNVLVADLVNAGALMAGSSSKGRIAAIFVFNRCFDLAATLFLLLLCFLTDGGRLQGLVGLHQGKAWVGLGVLLLAGGVLLLFRRRVGSALREVRDLVGRNGGLALGYAGFIYLCYVLAALSEFRALGLEAPGGYLLLSYLLGSLITQLPISVAGIGTRDLLFVFLLGLVGETPESALALSFLGFLLLPLLSLCVIYLLSHLGWPHEARSNS